ncbi:MAG: hypothetical protein ACUVT5_02020 [Candidatus Bathyarchaeales archaeon]
MKGYKSVAEAKLASLAWKLKLVQTSIEVTRTPITTLKSLLLDAVKNETPVYIEKFEKCLVNLGRTYAEAFTT